MACLHWAKGRPTDSGHAFPKVRRIAQLAPPQVPVLEHRRVRQRAHKLFHEVAGSFDRLTSTWPRAASPTSATAGVGGAGGWAHGSHADLTGRPSPFVERVSSSSHYRKGCNNNNKNDSNACAKRVVCKTRLPTA